MKKKYKKVVKICDDVIEKNKKEESILLSLPKLCKLLIMKAYAFQVMLKGDR